jgi:fermentation-respiration switch protein FrsA (DUF1100 family)
MLFAPYKEHFYTPDIFNVSYEDVYLESDLGLSLHGWRLKTSQHKKGNILFLHGNGENISTHFANMYWLVEHGYDGYIFDYRGYGKSEGVAELDGVIRDVDVMINYVIEQTPDEEQVIVIGHSLGGALAIYAVAESGRKHNISTLVTIEAFSDYRDITQDVLSTSWLTWLFQWPLSFTIDNSYSPVDVIDKVSPVPLLVMHSPEDMMINIYHGRALYAAALEPKKFVETEGDHNNIFKFEGNRKLLLDYLEQNQK